jgi:hypothetical protein
MKKYPLHLLLLLSFSIHATEKDSLSHFKKYDFSNRVGIFEEEEEEDCDACGCSASGGSMGFASMLTTNFIGIRYFNQSYKSRDGLYSNSPWYDENFNTIQVWGRIPIIKNVQATVLLPYHFHNRDSNDGKQNISGIGDITILGMYQIVQTKTDSLYFKHTLQLGGGLKMPTGKFDETNNGSVNPSYQVGTGSWDYLLATEYIIRRKNWGLNNMVNYVIKTENDKSYRFGNQFNYASTLFYLVEKNQFSYAPQLGIAYELYEDNYQRGQKVRDTAGDIFLGKLGIEVGKKNLSFGANYMIPIQQNLTGGNVEANYRWSLNLNYML